MSSLDGDLGSPRDEERISPACSAHFAFGVNAVPQANVLTSDDAVNNGVHRSTTPYLLNDLSRT